ncbi:MAG: tyrosine-type recombinase/integrase [Actinomycetota bacterium]
MYTAAYTGLRAGELWALKVNHRYLLRRRLDAVEALSEVRGRLATGPTKTGEKRTISLPVFLADMLGEHLGHYPSTGYVFTSRDGGPVRQRNFRRRHFKPAATEADLTGIRFHDLRHSCAAILIQLGWNPKQIQDRLGHASIRTRSTATATSSTATTPSCLMFWTPTFRRESRLHQGVRGVTIEGRRRSRREGDRARHLIIVQAPTDFGITVGVNGISNNCGYPERSSASKVPRKRTYTVSSSSPRRTQK